MTTTLGTRGVTTFIKDPSHARLCCEMLADCASKTYPHAKAYAVLRSLSPHELWELYHIWKEQGNDAFRSAFGPVFYGMSGEEIVGPLFEE